MFKRSTTYSPIRVLILTAIKLCTQGKLEDRKNNLRNALSCFTEAIELKCKFDTLNAELYSIRADIHICLGEFT